MSAINPYSKTEQLLHRLALGSTTRLEIAFAIEQKLYGSPLPTDSGDHVFIAGLARAGTTILLQLLHQSDQFCTLTYRDMPFVLSPNCWAKASGLWRQPGSDAERAHGDGVMVSSDSPEALEEVFWRTLCGSDYIHPHYLASMAASPEAVAAFRCYVKLILARYGSRRYLSKNNNNILRLASIRAAYPDAHIVVPFRHPLAQAKSLHRQHLLFCEQQQREPFVRRYMDWLVHCEFGQGHRPFFQPADTPQQASQPRYWLELWSHTYRTLLASAPADDKVIFLSYDNLCQQPEASWRKLAERLRIGTALPPRLDGHKPPPQQLAGATEQALCSALSIHAALLERAQ